MGLSADRVIELALELPETAEKVSLDGMSVARGDRGMIWTVDPKAKKLLGYKVKQDDAMVFAFRVSWDDHDAMLDAPGSVFFKRPHYDSYPALLVDSSDLTEQSARAMLLAAWKGAAEKVKYRKG